jgi:hypothetical protein
MATEGGQTYVASAYQLYNELAEKRPDVLQTLSDHWVLDTYVSPILSLLPCRRAGVNSSVYLPKL